MNKIITKLTSVFDRFNTASNSKKSHYRMLIVIGLIIIATTLALLGIYPSNYESLFTPINKLLYVFIWCCLGISILCLFSKKVIPGNDGVGNLSFVHMIATLGLACGFFSYVIDPSFISAYGIDDPYRIIMNWYGPFQWIIFVPFLLMEIWESEKGFPKWIIVIKRYVYALSMMLAIGISLMAGCNSIPKIIYSLFGIEVSPYLLMLPISILTAISLVRGIHKGMKLFSNLTMILMYVITFSFIIIGFSSQLPGEVFNEVVSTYKDFITLNTYTGTKFQIDQSAPFFIWMLTWVPIMSPFIKRVGQGRKLRTVVLLMILGPSIICSLYVGICSYVFPTEGGGISILADHPMLGISYVIMLILMFTTSADSTSYSLDEMITKGAKTSVSYRKLIWIVVMCTFITILMIAGGGSANALYGISYITAPIIMTLGLAMGVYMIVKTIINYVRK